MGHHPKANILAVRDGARRADRRQGRRRRQEDHPLRRGLELRRGRRRRPLRAGHPGEHGRHRHRAPSTTGSATPYAAAAPSTTTPASRASPPACTPTPTARPANGTAAEQKARLLHYQDLIKVGLTGNLRRLPLHRHRRQATSPARRSTTTAHPAGYTAAPGEARHLRRRARQRDRCTTRSPTSCRPAPPRPTGPGCRCSPWPPRRSRQGPAFVAGRQRPAALQVPRPQLLRQRRLVQRDPLGLRGATASARGLPPARTTRTSGRTPSRCWPTRPLVPDCAAINAADARYAELLRIRRSSPVFGLATAEQVQQRVAFPLSGEPETPGRADHDAGRPRAGRAVEVGDRRLQRHPGDGEADGDRAARGGRGTAPGAGRTRPTRCCGPRRSTGRPAPSRCRRAAWRCSSE